MATKQLNRPIEEPYQGRELTRREKARREKWPDMRFCEASIYAVGANDQCPQFEAFMDKNESYVLLVHPKESTAYCKQEDAHLYANRTMALLGEPKADYFQRQRDWQDLDERSRQTAVTDENGMVHEQSEGRSQTIGSYVEGAGERS